MSCPFCKIDVKRSKIIEKSLSCYVIFSNPRLVSGHLLVIPKRHVMKLSELSDVEKKDLLDMTIKYQEKLLKYFKGTQIKQNYMPFLKDSRLKVAHLHIHILPRENMDEIYTKALVHETKLFKDTTKKECDEWMKRLK